MHLWLPRKYFIIEMVIFGLWDNDKMMKKQFMLCKFNGININEEFESR